MQFLADVGLEHGEHQGLGWIGGQCVRAEPADPRLKVPHMGWNEVAILHGESPLVREVADGTAFYFLHSYHLQASERTRDCVVATTDHGGPLTAMVQKGHIFGVQFHPEKSQGAGLKVLRNFADLVAARG
jgi:glutamine amidotransferase